VTTIGILGSGNVSRALAGPLATLGYEIIVGSRTPGAVAWPDGVAVSTLVDAAARAEIVVNALPGSVCLGVLTSLRSALAGTILIDIANAVDIGDDGFATTLRYPGGSLAEEIQRALPETRVVKTLNTMHDSLMANPTSLPTALSVFLSGNEATAKRVVADILRELGWPQESIIDLGEVGTARWPEAFVLTVRPLIIALGPVPFGLAIAH
jgi:predicted dinucleotide-binding enzyme